MVTPKGGLRSARERLIQTLSFEAGGLLLVAPLFAHASDSAMGDAFVLMVTLSVVVMTWAAVFNTAVDALEYRVLGRLASDRPHGARVLHAVALEISSLIVTCPVIYAMTDLGWVGALIADLALTTAYAAYAYVFHLVFDRLRPVTR
jgi:uncharacterized membrane protein